MLHAALHSFENRFSKGGDGVFDKSITALQMLNEVGYGKEGTGFDVAFWFIIQVEHLCRGSQESLQKEFKKKLFDAFGIVF